MTSFAPPGILSNIKTTKTNRNGINCPSSFSMGGIPAVNGKGERLLLYIGIIDILQSYR